MTRRSRAVRSRVSGAVPRPLALLSDVLRRRFPRRRDRRRAGDDGQDLKAICDRSGALDAGLAAIRRSFICPSGFPPVVTAAADKPQRGVRPSHVDRTALRSSRSIRRARPISTRRSRSARRRRPHPALCDRRRRWLRRPTASGRRRSWRGEKRLPARRQGRLVSAGAERRSGQPAPGRRRPSIMFTVRVGSRRDD